jgi:hypothetical protein
VQLQSCRSSPAARQPRQAASSRVIAGVDQINHIVVIYLENHSFDNLYGLFPGANGIANAGNAAKQLDRNGTAYDVLPQPIDSNLEPEGPDPRFPANLPPVWSGAFERARARQATCSARSIAISGSSTGARERERPEVPRRRRQQRAKLPPACG